MLNVIESTCGRSNVDYKKFIKLLTYIMVLKNIVFVTPQKSGTQRTGLLHGIELLKTLIHNYSQLKSSIIYPPKFNTQT